MIINVVKTRTKKRDFTLEYSITVNLTKKSLAKTNIVTAASEFLVVSDSIRYHSNITSSKGVGKWGWPNDYIIT